jgi:hypothetical protein
MNTCLSLKPGAQERKPTDLKASNITAGCRLCIRVTSVCGFPCAGAKRHERRPEYDAVVKKTLAPDCPCDTAPRLSETHGVVVNFGLLPASGFHPGSQFRPPPGRRDEYGRA